MKRYFDQTEYVKKSEGKLKIKEFLLIDKNIERDTFIWNMSGSMLMAFQSVIMLMILTRTLGLVDAGIFTIAYANANLFLNVGKYGMRYFQISDMKKQFSFAEYRMSRLVTSVAMIVTAVIYTMYAAISNSYSSEKTQVIIWMCLFKIVDAVEDVYQGYYQNENRLDIASKCMTLRMIVTILVYALGLIILKNQLISLIIATIVTTILFVLFTKWTIVAFQKIEEKAKARQVVELLKICFPLFAGAFLSFYIGNAPKYAIDAMLTDELQACYGFIAMPVFVIGLLNNFIFNPMLYRLSMMWSKREIKKFVKKILLQVLIIAGITIVCIVGAFVLGIPALSWLYNTNLAPYKSELLLLLLGGGFLGLSGLLNAVITIIRYQKSLMWGYVIVALLALLFSNRVVGSYGIMGASILYTVLMAILCVIFTGVFVYGVMRQVRRPH